MVLTYILIIIIVLILIPSLKVVKEYERGVRFTFGRFTSLMQPGLRLVIPIIQAWRRIDIRTNVVDVPKQDAMTKDNVSVVINAVLYFKVGDPKLAVIEVVDYYDAISQLAQTTMRDVAGQVNLDELLGKRDDISKKIKNIVDKAAVPLGIKVESVELKDVVLPGSLIRVIAKEAEAEREKRAVIIKATGELESAENIVKAASSLSKVKGGLHIRTLQTINNLGNEKSITNVYAIPEEIMVKFAKDGVKI